MKHGRCSWDQKAGQRVRRRVCCRAHLHVATGVIPLQTASIRCRRNTIDTLYQIVNFYRAMLCLARTNMSVCLSVCPSVDLSHGSIQSKRLNI